MPTFERSIEINAPIQSVFDFHMDARNALRIASSGQKFASIDGEFPLVEGAEIVIKIRQAPLPIAQTWRVRVVEIVEPVVVVDELLKGPFAYFRHEHRFAPAASGGTVLTDHIRWKLPAGPVGRLLEPFVSRLLTKSFTERQVATKRILEAAAMQCR